MYTELNPFIWRWLIMAFFIAMSGLGLALVAIGRSLHRRALARRRAERTRSRVVHGRPATAS